MSSNHTLSRRHLLAGLGLGTASFALGDVLVGVRPARADALELLAQPLFVFVYFAGGWDTLLSLDPRDHTVYGNESNPSAIHTALGLVTDPVVQQVLAADPRGLVQPPGSNIAFGPAIGRLADHFADLCVVRGIDMGTLTHEVGRRYFITGKFPRGVLASGSALPTWIAAQDASIAAIPSLALGGMESYNEGLDPTATALSVKGHQDLAWVLRPVDPTLITPAAIEDALDAHRAVDHCEHRRLDVGGIVAAYRASVNKAKVVGSGALWQHFDFTPSPPAAIAEVYASFGIQAGNLGYHLAGPEGRAALAAQAITNDLCQTVSIQIESGLDTHFDNWATTHAPTLRRAFDAVADLITRLKQKQDPNGKSYWERTTLVCFSEFARTPRLNAQLGRDHHLCGSSIVAGNGIAGNRVIGASTPDGYDAAPFDFELQEPTSTGPRIRPADVHATLCEALGLGHEHISNQEPKLLTRMLANA